MNTDDDACTTISTRIPCVETAISDIRKECKGIDNLQRVLAADTMESIDELMHEFNTHAADTRKSIDELRHEFKSFRMDITKDMTKHELNINKDLARYGRDLNKSLIELYSICMFCVSLALCLIY